MSTKADSRLAKITCPTAPVCVRTQTPDGNDSSLIASTRSGLGGFGSATTTVRRLPCITLPTSPDSVFPHSPICKTMRPLTVLCADRICGVIYKQSSHQTNWCSAITNLSVSTVQNGTSRDNGG